MSDIQSSNIQTLAKVIESAQSGYAPKGLGERTLPESQANALTLTVVSSKNNLLILQAQNNSTRVSIARSDLQGLDARVSIQAGDQLVLINNSTKQATFSLQQLNSSSVKSLSAPILQALSQQWEDIPTSSLKKAMPSVLNQIALGSNSPLTRNIAGSIIDIAKQTGQPLVSIKLDAKVTNISANSFNLSILVSKNLAPVNLQLPLNLELAGKLKTNAQLSVLFDANAKQGLIRDISTNSQGQQQGSNQVKVSAESIKQLNQYLFNKPEQIKSVVAQLLINDQINKPKIGVVFDANKQTLSALDTNTKQTLLKNVTPQQLLDAKIVLSTNAKREGQLLSNNSGQALNGQLQLSILAKPILLSVSPENLSSLSQFSSSKQVNLNTSVSLSDSSSVIDNLNNKNTEQNPHSDKPLNGAANINKPITDVLLKNLTQIVSQSQLQSLKNNTTTNNNMVNNAAAAQFNTNQTIGNVQKVIANELNQTLAHSMSITKTIPLLTQQLQSFRSSATPDLNQLLNNALAQINNDATIDNESVEQTLERASDTANNTLSAQQVKQIFSSAILPNASTGVGQFTPGSGGLINGLLTMLQSSLQAKLLSQQPNLSSQLQTILPVINANKGTRPQQTTTRALQELHRADPNGKLIGEINKVLSNHSLHKLAGAETSLQGQDSFYYALPNMFSPEYKDIEIVIRREQHSESENKKNETHQQWQLSMKLDVGASGEVLAKVKLISDNVDLHLYASNQTLKDTIVKLLPLLNKRLSGLGLTVKPQCYVGKIPDKLYKTDFQVVQAYV